VGEDQSQTGRQRLTVAEASAVLGVTVEAVRGRIKRGTLDHERTDKGVFVFLEADQTTDRLRPDTDQTADRLRSDSDALISAKDETIATLRDQLEAERQAHAEARRIIAGLVERIPALEPPADSAPDAPGSPERGEAGGAGGGVPEEPQMATSRPWWRRLFS
jgi:Mg2+ and Co2+ transporter CorA